MFFTFLFLRKKAFLTFYSEHSEQLWFIVVVVSEHFVAILYAWLTYSYRIHVLAICYSGLIMHIPTENEGTAANNIAKRTYGLSVPALSPADRLDSVSGCYRQT